MSCAAIVWPPPPVPAMRLLPRSCIEVMRVVVFAQLDGDVVGGRFAPSPTIRAEPVSRR